VEIDNYGVTRQPGKAGAGGIWVGGYDEITWFRAPEQSVPGRVASATPGTGSGRRTQTVTSSARQPDGAGSPWTPGGWTTLMCRAEAVPDGLGDEEARSGHLGRPTRAAGNGIGHEDARGLHFGKTCAAVLRKRSRAARLVAAGDWTMKTSTIPVAG